MWSFEVEVVGKCIAKHLYIQSKREAVEKVYVQTVEDIQACYTCNKNRGATVKIDGRIRMDKDLTLPLFDSH